MKTQKLKRQTLSFMTVLLTSGCLSVSAIAQGTQTFVSVDDDSLVAKIERQADVVMTNKEWTIGKLRNNVKDLKNTDRAKIVLPKASDKLMNAEEIYEKRRWGVIMVGTYYNCGNCSKMHSSLASGAVLNEEGFCITNYHVLEGIIEAKELSKSRDSLAFISTMDGKVFPITDIISYSKAGDVAIFKVDTKGERLASVPLGMPAKTGSKVHAITHPDGYHYFYSEGVVARNVNYGKLGPDADRMEITADYAKGSSGGPIFDSYGNLIGLVSTTSSIYYDEQQQKNLQMVIKSTIPISVIKRLLI